MNSYQLPLTAPFTAAIYTKDHSIWHLGPEAASVELACKAIAEAHAKAPKSVYISVCDAHGQPC